MAKFNPYHPDPYEEDTAVLLLFDDAIDGAMGYWVDEKGHDIEFYGGAELDTDNPRWGDGAGLFTGTYRTTGGDEDELDIWPDSVVSSFDFNTTFWDPQWLYWENTGVTIDTDTYRWGGGAASFPGGDVKLYSTDSALDLTGVDDWTIEFWVYPTALPAVDAILFGNDPGISLYRSRFMFTTTGYFVWDIYGGRVLDNYQIPLNEWTHIAITHSTNMPNATVRVFSNGVCVSNIFNPGGTRYRFNYGTYGCNLGKDFVGLMDYYRVTTEDRYCQPQLRIPYHTDFNHSGDWTYEGWIYLREAPTESSVGLIYTGDGYVKTNVRGLILTSGRYLGWHQYGYYPDYLWIADEPIPLETWTHFACVKKMIGSQSKFRIFMDGRIVFDMGLGDFTKTFCDVKFCIGGSDHKPAQAGINGSLDAVRLSKRARYWDVFTPPPLRPVTFLITD